MNHEHNAERQIAALLGPISEDYESLLAIVAARDRLASLSDSQA